MQSSPPNHATATFAAELDASWTRYLLHVKEQQAARAAFIAAERARVPEAVAQAYRSDDADDARVQVFDALIEHASQAFAPAHARLKIERADLTTECYRRRHNERFAPSRVWTELAAQFGGAAGAERAHRQAADAIAHMLKLRRTVPKSVGGSVSIEGYLGTDMPYSGPGRTLSYPTTDGFSAFLRGFETFLADLDPLRYATEITALRQLAGNLRFSFVSRHRVPLGPSLGLVLFFEKFELRVTPELAAELNLYLTSHASRHLVEAA